MLPAPPHATKGISTKVELNLPKLQKVDKSKDPHKIKLPKLKKINKKEEIVV